MAGFDFKQPLHVMARAGAKTRTLARVAIALAVVAGPWTQTGQHMVMSSDQMMTYRTISQQFRDQAVLPDRAGTCFGQQLSGQANLDNIKASTIMIGVGEVFDGRLGSLASNGTGYVVADSGNGGPNRIVTANHVVHDMAMDSNKANSGQGVYAFSSDGKLIGRVRIVQGLDHLVNAGTVRAQDSARKLEAGDVAVLEIQTWAPGARQRFAQVRGLDLAATPGHGWIAGDTDPHTPGVYGGHSGSPVIDAATGRVLATTVAASSGNSMDEYRLGSMVDMSQSPNHSFSRDQFVSVTQNDFKAETFSNGVLSALGHQGRVVMANRADNRTELGHDAIVAGMPMHSCIMVKATTGGVLAYGTGLPLKAQPGVALGAESPTGAEVGAPRMAAPRL